MKRSSPSLHFLAVAASIDTILMSSRPSYRGGRNQWRRGYSDRNVGDQFVTGDSHFRSVRDTNRSFGSEERGNFENHNQFRPQPRQQPPFNPRPSFDPNAQPFYPNQQFRPPPFYENQQFRPPFQQNQQFRPRTKPPDYRNWEYAQPGPPLDCERFTVLSYNILADYLAINHRSKLYYHIPRHFLDWEYRKKSIIFELGLWSADILCFQEVDKFQDLETDLKVRGYNGIWKMRTGDPVDGCAIFWRVSRFKLLHEESIEFSKLGLRNNVAQICVFESLNQSQNHNTNTSGLRASAAGFNKVVICNIHVLYNPRRGEIKLGQVRVLLERAYAVSKLWDDAPVVLCGDFNFTPESPLYTFISDQKLNLSELPRDKLSGQASAEIRPQSTFSPYFRGPPTYNSARAPTMVEPKTEVQQGKDVSKDETELTRRDPASDINESEDVSKDETELTQCDMASDINERTICSESEAASSDKQIKDEIGEYSSPNSHQGLDYPIETELREENQSSDLLHEIPSSNVPKVSYEGISKNGITISLDNLSLNDELFKSPEDDETLGEDCDTFLSELHNDGVTQFPRSEASYVERNMYDPSAWTPMEIEIATGSSESTLIEHPLKLRSTYSQVEDLSGTRDSHGEPQVTSYNRCFQGTVDYIWCSQDLQTVRVLAPIPKHAMQWTPGFPTKKWGSDHIALVSELAFTKDATLESSEVQ